MKLIIDIPEEVKRNIDTFKGHFLCGYSYDLMQAIKDGTPLDSNSDRAEVQAYFDGQAYGWEQGREDLIKNIKLSLVTDLSWEMFDEYGNETRLHKELWEILDNIGKGE